MFYRNVAIDMRTQLRLSAQYPSITMSAYNRYLREHLNFLTEPESCNHLFLLHKKKNPLDMFKWLVFVSISIMIVSCVDLIITVVDNTY